MITVLYLALVQSALGAFDTLYYHEYVLRLPKAHTAKLELMLHASRDFAYGLIFLSLAWIEWQGIFALLFALVILAEVVITLWDFIEEDRTRKLPKGERAMHAIMGIVYGLMMAYLAPILWEWWQQPTGFHTVSYGWLSLVLSAGAVGVVGSGIRDVWASRGMKGNLIPILLTAALLGLAAGCSSPDKNPKIDIPEDVPLELNPDTTGTVHLAALEEAVKARTSTGDTLLADVNKLSALLTDSIAGYVQNASSADTLKMPLSSMTSAKKLFYNAQEADIELSASDYVQDPDFFRVAVQRHNLADGLRIEGVTDLRKSGPGILPDWASHAFTWSSYSEGRRIAQVFIGVDWRYFITIEASDRDGFLDLAQAAKWLHWEALKK